MKLNEQYVLEQIRESISTKEKTLQLNNEIWRAAQIIVQAFRNGKKLLIFGNGGSAADAQHLAAEFINKFRFDRQPLPAISLCTDSSVLTAISNDSGYDYVFEKQIKALGNSGDVVIAITTSDVSKEKYGHSACVYNGIIAAKERGMITIGLFSEKTKIASQLVDLAIQIPATDTARIQEAHLMVYHIICDIVEQELCVKL